MNKYKQAWLKFLADLKPHVHDVNLVLTEVNNYFNLFKYETDTINYNMKDHWATVDEFFNNLSGDCEDLALMKFVSLRKLGMDPDKIKIAWCFHVLGSYQTAHMVALYDNYVLDNIEREVKTIDEVANTIKIVYTMDETSSYVNGSPIEVNKRFKNYSEDLTEIA